MQWTHVKLLNYFCLVYLFPLFYYFTWNMQTYKVKKQPFKGAPSQVLAKDFDKIFKYFSFHFRNLGVVGFRKHFSVFTNIHSFSFIFILLAVFTNCILEHFLFIILSLNDVVSFVSMFMMNEQALWAYFVR